MNKIGIYFAFWEKEWEADYCRYIEKAKNLGFDVLELAAGCLPDMTAAQRREIASRAEDAGIDLTYCIGLPPQYDLACEDASVRASGIRYVGELLKCIRQMGGDTLGGIIYSCWPGGTVTYDYKQKARERSLDSLRELSHMAEEYDINYCLEIVNRYEQYLLNTAAEGADFVRELDSPKVKLLLDCFHMNIEEDSFSEAIKTSGELLGHFHIGECNRKVPGRGHMDWDDLIRGLRDIDYRGKIVMEPFVRPGGQVGKDIKIYRDQSGDASEAQMDEMAEEALTFIREKLRSGGDQDGKN